jgi:hypothetical protein
LCAPFTGNKVRAKISVNGYMRGVAGLGKMKGKERKQADERTREDKAGEKGKEGGKRNRHAQRARQRLLPPSILPICPCRAGGIPPVRHPATIIGCCY